MHLQILQFAEEVAKEKVRCETVIPKPLTWTSQGKPPENKLQLIRNCVSLNVALESFRWPDLLCACQNSLPDRLLPKGRKSMEQVSHRFCRFGPDRSRCHGGSVEGGDHISRVAAEEA